METNTSDAPLGGSTVLLALRRLRVRVRRARTLVKRAFEYSTEVYWSVPTVDLSEEFWEVFHPLTTIGNHLENIQRELARVESRYQQFTASHQPSRRAGAPSPLVSQETLLGPAQQHPGQPLPFPVHVTLGTRFGRSLSTQEVHDLMKRYHGYLIAHTISARRGTEHSILTFFADLRDVTPAFTDDLGSDTIRFATLRNPFLSEYTTASRFIHQRAAESPPSQPTPEEQDDGPAPAYSPKGDVL